MGDFTNYLFDKDLNYDLLDNNEQKSSTTVLSLVLNNNKKYGYLSEYF